LDVKAAAYFASATTTSSALALAGPSREVVSFFAMEAKATTPILNVSEMKASFAWFEKWGWKKLWDWGSPPSFGAVGSGECEIFLCLGGQGGRGRGKNKSTFGPEGDQESDKGVWMSLWVDDVDAVHRECVAAGIEITFPPTNMPWNVREMHVRHPDGHVFRVSKGIGE
jgi:catechol 2,3-dioxygenase-like lactoylglutathione lyase family enzyme